MESKKERTDMEVDLMGTSFPETAKSSMETVSDPTKDVMASGAVGSITCSLHPLVIMNVSEHWTRERAQEGAVQQGNLKDFF